MQKFRSIITKKPAQKRFRFVTDGDGHDYLIPENEVEQFLAWVDNGPYWEDYTGKDYNDFRVGTSINNFTFTDPKEDHDLHF